MCQHRYHVVLLQVPGGKLQDATVVEVLPGIFGYGKALTWIGGYNRGRTDDSIVAALLPIRCKERQVANAGA